MANERNDAKTEQERRKETLMKMSALRLQERQESREEIAAHIYRYKGAAMRGGGALLCPGDYMTLSGDDHFLTSARGAQIGLDTGDLEKLVEAGALDHVFHAADLNSPAFQGKLDAILDRMSAQAEYRDAYAYCPIHGNKAGKADKPVPEAAAAMFAKDPLSGMPTAVIIRSGAEFAAAAGTAMRDGISDIAKSAGEAMAPERQCSYEEFNPGAKDIKAELEKDTNGERESMDEKFKALRDEIMASNSAGKGGTDKKPEAEKPEGRKPSAYEELKAAAAEQERAQAERAAQAENEEDLSPLAGSRAMRRFAD